MTEFAADALALKIPITLITGFLGAGKTTLVRHLLTHPETGRAAVVINEVGEIGIDDDLVRASTETVSLMANGCLCCAVRTDLQDTLRELFGDRRAGMIPDFERVILETSGLADPGPVIQTLITDTMLNARYRLDGVVTLVDAVNAFDQLAASPEAERQVALADRIFITKEDLSDSPSLDRLTFTLRGINPLAAIRRCTLGQVHPDELSGIGLGSSRKALHGTRFLASLKAARSDDAEEAQESYLGCSLPKRHDPNVRTLSIQFDKPFSWQAFTSAMEMLIGLRGKDLLRVKGIVNVDGKPVVVQGVGHVFHDPVHLQAWPSADSSSRIVFIARGMDTRALHNVFSAARVLGSSISPDTP